MTDRIKAIYLTSFAFSIYYAFGIKITLDMILAADKVSALRTKKYGGFEVITASEGIECNTYIRL